MEEPEALAAGSVSEFSFVVENGRKGTEKGENKKAQSLKCNEL